MKRGSILAGAAAVGGLIAAFAVPKSKFVYGAALGTGAGLAAATLLVPKPKEPIMGSGGQLPVFVLPKSVTMAVAKASGHGALTPAEYRRRLAIAGLKVTRQTDWYSRTSMKPQRVISMKLPMRTYGSSPIPGWLGALVGFGAAAQALYIKFLIDRGHNAFDGEWGTRYISGWGQENVSAGGPKRWRDLQVEWPAPCDTMGDVKWIAKFFKSRRLTDAVGNAPRQAVLRYEGMCYQDLLDMRFVKNFIGHDKPKNTRGRWMTRDYEEFQIGRRAEGGDLYGYCKGLRGQVVHPRIAAPIGTYNTREGTPLARLEDYYQIGYWLVWAAETWRVQMCIEESASEPSGFRYTGSKFLKPPNWWVQHCLAWGVGVASEDRFRRGAQTIRQRYGIIPQGPPGITGGNIFKLFERVIAHTPPPGYLASGTELQGKKVLHWPRSTEESVAAQYRPGWEWPGATIQTRGTPAVWDAYIGGLRAGKSLEGTGAKIMKRIASTIQAVAGAGAASAMQGAVSLALASFAGEFVQEIANNIKETIQQWGKDNLKGVLTPLFNCLDSFTIGAAFRSLADTGFTTILSNMSIPIIAGDLSLRELGETRIWLANTLSELDNHFGFTDDLLGGELEFLGSFQSQYNSEVKALGGAVEEVD